MNYSTLFSTHSLKYQLLSLAICLMPMLTMAQTSPNATINDKPISIDADNQQIDIQKNTITFTGNVVIVQDGLKIKADTVIITEMQSQDKQVITAYGKPVYFEQIIKDNAKKTIIGHANELAYQVKQNRVTLSGNAELFQLDNHLSSDKIIYDVEQQKIQAQSKKGSRVKTTIVPNQVKEIKQ